MGWGLAAALTIALATGCEDDVTVAGPEATVVDPLAGLNSNDVPSNAAGGRRFIARSTAAVDSTPGEVIEIEMTDDAISFPASCNTGTAAYVVLDGVLHLSTSQASTAMACSPQQDAEASRISTMLNEQPNFDVDRDMLTIATPTASFQLIDADAPNPDDLPLIGTQWRITLLADVLGGGQFSSEGGTVNFADGVADVTVACIHRTVPTTIVEPNRQTHGTVSGVVRPLSVPTSTLPPPHATTTSTTSPPPPPTMTFPTVTDACDPDRPSEWALDVLDTLTGELTLEVDINKARLRRTDGTGIDLTAI